MSPCLETPTSAASAGLFYTSGTTGRAKGVTRPAPTAEQVAQRQVALTMCYGIRPGCTSLVTTPLHHIFAQGMALATLRAGGTVVIMPRFDAQTFLDLVERHLVTTAQMVPTMFVRLLRLPEDRRAPRTSARSSTCCTRALRARRR